MPAENGAIDVVRRDSDKTIAYEVVGDGESIGISPCGAVTAAAAMQRGGILDSDGIMTNASYMRRGGFRRLLEIGAVRERFKSAAFCRNAAEQGIIAFLEDENTRNRAFEIISAAKDLSQDNLLKYDISYLNNLNF